MHPGGAKPKARLSPVARDTPPSAGVLETGEEPLDLSRFARQALADGYHRRSRDDCLPGTVFQVSGQAIDAHPRTGDKLIMLDKIATSSNGDDLLTFPLKKLACENRSILLHC